MPDMRIVSLVIVYMSQWLAVEIAASGKLPLSLWIFLSLSLESKSWIRSASVLL